MYTAPRNEEDRLKIRDEILATVKWGQTLFSDEGFDAVVKIALDFEYCYTEEVPILIGDKTTPRGISVSESKWIFYLVTHSSLLDHTELCLDNSRETIYYCSIEDLKSYIRAHFTKLKKAPPNVILTPEQFKEIFKPF